MKLLLVLILSVGFSTVAFADGSNCKAGLDQEASAPFSQIQRDFVHAQLEDYSILDEKEEARLKKLLHREDVEVYSSDASEDAGFHILVLENRKCKTLWSGFIVEN